MNILFTHGYFIKEDEKEKAIMRPYPPLGILYISAWLEQKGYDNTVFDTTFAYKADLKQYLLKTRPTVIAFYTNLMTKLNIIELLQFVKDQVSLQDSKVVVGGPDVSYNIENYLLAGADVVVFGEGEQTMLELVQSIENGVKDELAHIAGLAYFSADSQLIKTADRERIRPVDSLPFPNRKKIDMQLYLDVWKGFHGKSTMSVSTQRGCPYTCKWCSTAVYGQSYRRRSPELVVEEMALLKETYHPDALWFVDDVFTVSHKWIEGFNAALKKRGWTIPYECITRAERMSPEIIQLLKESGCFRVWIGAESGSQKIIDRMDRRVKVETVQSMIQLSRQSGIEAGTFIMLGYPGETEDDIKATVQHLKLSNPHHFTITLAYPIKGTGLYEEIEAQQLADLDWNKTTDRDRDFERSYSRKYYDYAIRWVVNEVNYHQHKLENGRFNIRGFKTKTKSIAAKLGMLYHRQSK
jgi:radical SAM superfamily enzyme YgiQ (UPF0313 family)